MSAEFNRKFSEIWARHVGGRASDTLKVSAVADALGLCDDTIRNWIVGENIPGIFIINKIANSKLVKLRPALVQELLSLIVGPAFTVSRSADGFALDELDADKDGDVDARDAEIHATNAARDSVNTIASIGKGDNYNLVGKVVGEVKINISKAEQSLRIAK